MEKPVIIFGSAGIAKSALDIFNSNEVMVYGFLDDDQTRHNEIIRDVSVLGATEDREFTKLLGENCEAFIAYDELSLHKEYVAFLLETHKVMPVNAIHRTALISPDVGIGHGNFVNVGVILANQCSIENHNIVHCGAVIEQDVKIGNFVQIGAGSVINNRVHIEDEVFIGSGVTIVSGVRINKGARVGAGSVVVSDVKAGTTIFGNPATLVETK